ncbi:MAG: fibronectin type III domain-containing protein, partial [Bacteroidales bacterium]|nr:fibronectin type III domain-containing protein [Bacteroidales bacterium]
NYAFYRCEDLTGTLDIPATVTSIGSNAFYYCSGFTGTLNIPSSVTSIGNYSFAYCTSFSALRFNSADTLTSIGEGAFYDCSGLAGELDIPDSVTSIGFNAFNGCSGFTGPLIIPNSVTSIGDNAFVNCSGLTGPLTISDAVTSIGYMTFYGCSGLTGGLDIPNSVTSIGDFAFSGCTGFTGALTIPDSVTSIGDRTFENCTGFTGALTIPASVTSIGDYAFFNCRGFTGALTISNSVTSIGSSAFLNCSGFTGALTIPNSVTSIGAYAFYECTGFTGALTIPDSVTFIGNQAFYHCYSISALELQGDTLPATMGDDVFKNCSELNKLIVPATWIGGASVTLPGIAFLPFTGNKLIKDAGLDSVLGEALSTPAGGAGAAAGTPITWSIDVANDVTEVTSANIVPSAGSTAALYSNADFTANEGASITLTEGGATTAYIKVAGDDTRTVRYHAVTINHVAVVPGAPTSATAIAGDTQAIVSFTAPASNGGAAITGYTVTASPADVPPVSGAGSPIVVTGLTNGQAYTFTVTATNNVGTGAASTASNSITPAATQTITFMNPGAQTFGTSLTLTATADSGLPVTFTSATPAVATITPDGVLTFVTAGTATINANQAGNSSYLPAAEVSRTFTVNPSVPGAPTSVTATAGDTQASVSFTAPASNGGAAIIGYTVTSSPVGFTATGASSPITINGLTNGQAYTFTVTATNSVGTGAASTASNSVTPLAPPSSGGGGGGGTPALVTRIDNGGSVTGTNVANLVKEGKSLTVEGKTGEKLVFDTEALKNIDGQTKESLKVEIKDVSADHAAKHPDRLVVSLTVTAGGKHITNFGSGTATVS